MTLIEKLEAHFAGATEGPWVVWTQNEQIGSIHTKDSSIMIAQSQQVSGQDQINGSPIRIKNTELLAAVPQLLRGYVLALHLVEISKEYENAVSHDEMKSLDRQQKAVNAELIELVEEIVGK